MKFPLTEQLLDEARRFELRSACRDCFFWSAKRSACWHDWPDEGQRRWPLEATLVVHRYGRLVPGDRIVLVAVASAHREAAFEACQFLIDWLKTKAPFWKLEDTDKGAAWVGAHASDDQAAARWERK